MSRSILASSSITAGRLIVDRSADFRAEQGALKGKPQDRHHDTADEDDEKTIGRDFTKPEINLTGQEVRHRDGRRGRAVNEGHNADRHKDQSDRQQHLIKLSRFIKRGIEKAFKRDAANADNNRCNGECRDKRHAIASHQGDQYIATNHGKSAMRQIDEPHQAHRHG